MEPLTLARLEALETLVLGLEMLVAGFQCSPFIVFESRRITDDSLDIA